VLEVPSWECQRLVAIPAVLLVEDSQLSRYIIQAACEAVKPSRFTVIHPLFGSYARHVGCRLGIAAMKSEALSMAGCDARLPCVQPSSSFRPRYIRGSIAPSRDKDVCHRLIS